MLLVVLQWQQVLHCAVAAPLHLSVSLQPDHLWQHCKAPSGCTDACAEAADTILSNLMTFLFGVTAASVVLWKQAHHGVETCSGHRCMHRFGKSACKHTSLLLKVILSLHCQLTPLWVGTTFLILSGISLLMLGLLMLCTFICTLCPFVNTSWNVFFSCFIFREMSAGNSGAQPCCGWYHSLGRPADSSSNQKVFKGILILKTKHIFQLLFRAILLQYDPALPNAGCFMNRQQAILDVFTLFPLGVGVLIGFPCYCCHGHLGSKLWVDIPITQEIICAPS